MLATLETTIEAGDEALTERARAWRAWLFDQALPVWAEQGVNPQGGFFDRLAAPNAAVPDPLRMRVQGRQSYVFAQAGKLGWSGDWERVVRHGLDFLLERAAREDGLVTRLFALDGSVLEAEPDLYDQPFALLAYASAFGALGDSRARDAGLQLLGTLNAHRHPSGGFRELGDEGQGLKSNPQMHLLEACLAWTEVDDHPAWRHAVDDLMQLCSSRLVDPGTGVLREFFVGDWTPEPGPAGQRTEPGHHFEWAWLLGRRPDGPDPDLRQRLCGRAERLGVDPVRKVAMNAISVDGEVLDATARLWPQTERLKALLMLREQDPRWTARACEASDALAAYTRPAAPGLWVDVMEADGSMRPEPAPASSLYHITCAVSELMKATGLTA